MNILLNENNIAIDGENKYTVTNIVLEFVSKIFLCSYNYDKMEIEIECDDKIKIMHMFNYEAL